MVMCGSILLLSAVAVYGVPILCLLSPCLCLVPVLDLIGLAGEASIPGLFSGVGLAAMTDVPRAMLDMAASFAGGPAGVCFGTVITILGSWLCGFTEGCMGVFLV